MPNSLPDDSLEVSSEFEREFLERFLAHHQALADADNLEFENRVIEDLTKKPDDYMGPEGRGYWPFEWPIGELRMRALLEFVHVSPGYEWTEVVPTDKKYTLSWEGISPTSDIKRLANLVQWREEVWAVVTDETQEWAVETIFWLKYPMDDGMWDRAIKLGEDLKFELKGPLPVGEIDARAYAANAILVSIADGANEEN